MEKFKQIFYVVIGTLLCEGVILIFIKFLSDTTISVNATLMGAHNMTRYPGTLGFLLSTPWILYFVPAVIGIVLVVLILKRQSA